VGHEVVAQGEAQQERHSVAPVDADGDLALRQVEEAGDALGVGRLADIVRAGLGALHEVGVALDPDGRARPALRGEVVDPDPVPGGGLGDLVSSLAGGEGEQQRGGAHRASRVSPAWMRALV
jgi:hypothetical protein